MKSKISFLVSQVIDMSRETYTEGETERQRQGCDSGCHNHKNRARGNSSESSVRRTKVRVGRFDSDSEIST